MEEITEEELKQIEQDTNEMQFEEKCKGDDE